MLGLGEKLDLADSAAAELDVVSADGDIAAALMGLDLTLDGMNVLDGGEIQVLTPDKGGQAFQEGIAGVDIAGHRAALDHRRALPVLAEGLVIGFRRQHRDGHRGDAGIGPEPEVDAEDVAVGGAFIDQADHFLGQADEVFLQAFGVAVAVPVYNLFRVVKDDQVDVARIVEFPRPQFTHGDDDQAGVSFRVIGVVESECALAGGVGQDTGRGQPEGGGGEIGKGAGDFFKRPDAGDIGQRHGQRRLPFGGPEQQGERFGLKGFPTSRTQAFHNAAKCFIGAGGQQPLGEPGIVDHRGGQERAVAEDRFQGLAAERVADDLFGEIGETGLRCGFQPATEADLDPFGGSRFRKRAFTV